MVTLATAVPRLVIAAPASGSGKTTVATGLMAAFAAGGLAVSPHKVGPDYIDPGYHALATGRPGRNLDAYLCGPDLLPGLFAHGARGADLAVVEGVMGLYDGAAGQGELASTAQVAKVLRAPVVLVVDASSQSRSVAALVHGFASWDPEVRLAGVVLNKVGSDRHEELLREALTEVGVPVFGALRRAEAVHTPSRHLGLVPVAERRADAVAAVAELADRVRAGCDLPGLLELARSAPALPGGAWDPADALYEAGLGAAVAAGPGAAGRPSGAGAAAAGAEHGAAGPGDGNGAPGLTYGASAARHGAQGAAQGAHTGGNAGPEAPGAGARPVVALARGSAGNITDPGPPDLLTPARAAVLNVDPP
ncbi:cobyrinate a,c-diamide synthase, partial [Streptomyces sp. HSW2009]|uniref:cobyrinate a,c-diamide synthase n=1 Tax=Streptomyces sp. HSW2009 TaxID=3142890 RepID=UPI0032ECDF5C